MEDLLNSMKVVFKNTENEEESAKYLHFSPKYKPPVKIANWFLPLEAYPKDNDPYDPPGGDYFLSTYKRLGTQDAPWETTTQSMLQQICPVEPDLAVYKPMVNFATDKLLEENLQDYEGIGSEENDFVTTYNYDYRHPFPYVKRYSLKTEVKDKHFGVKKTPFNTLSDLCETKFMDDDLYTSKCPPASKLIPRRS